MAWRGRKKRFVGLATGISLLAVSIYLFYTELRPVATGGPIRKARRHLWRGGHDPEQIKRAVTVRLKADPSDITPGAPVQFTLTLTNSGAGHYLPTGDPDRYFTVEFQVLDSQCKILKEESHTIGRWIIWQPVSRPVPVQSRGLWRRSETSWMKSFCSATYSFCLAKNI